MYTTENSEKLIFYPEQSNKKIWFELDINSRRDALS